ncbi:MAG: hypothetical protein WD052_10910 [Bacteroidales bacterium]
MNLALNRFRAWINAYGHSMNIKNQEYGSCLLISTGNPAHRIDRNGSQSGKLKFEPYISKVSSGHLQQLICL